MNNSILRKSNILLDLDQTLISAEPAEEYNFNKNKQKAEKFTYHDMDGYYIVFERPGLQEFLDWLFKNYNVSVWTAASKDYALFVIDKIILQKNNRELDYIFFSYHCDVSDNKKNGTKDIKTLRDIFDISGYNLNNTVILDDYNEVHNTQPKNCIIAHPFEFTNDKSPNDKFLNNLQPHLSDMKLSFDQGKSVQDSVEQINKKMKGQNS